MTDRTARLRTTTLRQTRLRTPSPTSPGRPMSRQELADSVNAYSGDQKPAAVDEIRPHVGRDVAVGRLYDAAGGR